jgi:hypothetical protein
MGRPPTVSAPQGALRDPNPRWLRALVVASGLWTAARPAGAAEPRVDPEAAADRSTPADDALRHAQRRLLERAKQHYEAGRQEGADAHYELERALDALRLAHRLRPAPWMLFNLAQVQSQLGGCRRATELYQQFVASDPGPEARASAERALQLLGGCAQAPEPSLGDGLPPGLERSLSPASLPEQLARATAPSLLLEEARAVSSGTDADPAPWLWAFAGVSVTSALVATVFYGQAHAAKADLDRLRVAGPRVTETQERGEIALDRARAFGGLSAGFALAVGATYWLYPTPSDEAVPSSGWSRLSWVPLEGGGVGAYRFEF